MFTPDKDLTTIILLMRKDEPLLKLLDLSGDMLTAKANSYISKHPSVALELAKTTVIAQSIIARSKWDGLATNEKRLCVYFLPDRRMRNESFKQSVLQVDCHVPATQDCIAYRVLERVYTLLHRKKLNKRYIFFDGQLGELPTMQGFFCAGSRFEFKRII